MNKEEIRTALPDYDLDTEHKTYSKKLEKPRRLYLEKKILTGDNWEVFLRRLNLPETTDLVRIPFDEVIVQEKIDQQRQGEES